MIKIKKIMRKAGHVFCIAMMERAYKTLVGKSGGKIPFGRPRSRWENNIRMSLQRIAYEGVGWVHLAKDRVQWRAMLCSESVGQSFREV
jgi:hypothetical protein